MLRLVLIAACLHAVTARLLAASRKPASLLPADMDVPVFQLLHQGQSHSRVGAWALKGTPTHFQASGCKKVSKAYNEVKSTVGASSMSVGRCFAFCSGRKGFSYFGLSNGGDCMCATAIDATAMDSGACDKPCAGKPSDICGGIEGTSMYIMIDCTPDTQSEKDAKRAEQKEALISSYGSFEGQTCGQEEKNVVNLNDKGFLSGSVETCKLACWEAKGAEECHGFTYESLTQKCTFHIDVTAGDVKKDPKTECYFKMSR
jgi:hypothetical protein